MAVLTFRHGPAGSLGRIADVLDVHSVEWRYVDVPEEYQSALPIEDAQALIVLGGPMSVNDPLPWLRQEERWIVRAVSSGVPVLGICLGAQLLAKCLGARVSPLPQKEIGWHPVHFNAAALDDPLLSALPPEEIFFHWHGETFELPAETQALASSELCANQAFRYGSSCYGLQFHPEVTPEIIRQWCDEDAACGALRESQQPVNPDAHDQRMHHVTAQIFGRWCNMIAAH